MVPDMTLHLVHPPLFSLPGCADLSQGVHASHEQAQAFALRYLRHARKDWHPLENTAKQLSEKLRYSLESTWVRRVGRFL